MTQEEKAKRYDEAIKVAEKYNNGTLKDVMETIFPELQESDDEKIRKALINQFNDYKRRGENHGFGYSNDIILAWLEKQGKDNMGISESTKQKLEDNLNKALEKETPESWNEFLEKQDERKPIYSEEQHEKEPLSDIENRIINFAMQFHDNRMKPESEWEDELKMLRDNIKIDTWNEEDEVKINRIVACLENLNVADNDILLKDVDWLKSLKERYTWKPSDRELDAILTVIGDKEQEGSDVAKELLKIYHHLKKLKA